MARQYVRTQMLKSTWVIEGKVYVTQMATQNMSSVEWRTAMPLWSSFTVNLIRVE